MQPKYGSLIEPSLDLSQGPVAEEPRAQPRSVITASDCPHSPTPSGDCGATAPDLAPGAAAGLRDPRSIRNPAIDPAVARLASEIMSGLTEASPEHRDVPERR
jgi:hypothetical protein